MSALDRNHLHIYTVMDVLTVQDTRFQLQRPRQRINLSGNQLRCIMVSTTTRKLCTNAHLKRLLLYANTDMNSQQLHLITFREMVAADANNVLSIQKRQDRLIQPINSRSSHKRCTPIYMIILRLIMSIRKLQLQLCANAVHRYKTILSHSYRDRPNISLDRDVLNVEDLLKQWIFRIEPII